MRSHSSSTLGMTLVAAAMALIATGCSESPLAVETTTDAGDPAVRATVRMPMHIRAAVEAVGPVDPLPEGCLVAFHTAIEGEATYLGDLSGLGSTCVLHQTAPDPDPPFLAPGPAPYATAPFSVPRWTLTGASGDELWLETIEAVAVISLVDGSLKARGRLRIIGGTGRFTGASGVVSANSINEDGLGPDDFQARGWIQLASWSHGRG